MKVLLDTHIFIWWDSEPKRLTAKARAVCEDPSNTLILSVASLWEMQIKQQLGKLTLRLPLAQLVDEQQTRNHVQILSVGLEHVLALDGIAPHHKDPFDRLLIAQANTEGLVVLIADPIFQKYNINLVG
jgi:PIN domain nuclease of toxin-antitoxin system